MKGCLKTFTILVGILLILGAIVVLFAVSQVDAHAKDAVVSALSYATGTDLDVKSFRIIPLRPWVEITGLSVANPKPFKEGPAITIDKLLIQFDPKTLFSATPTIEQVLLDGAKFRVRYRLGEGTNLGALAQHAAGDSPPDQPGASTKRAFVIKQLHCEHSQLSLGANLVPLATMNINMAPFTINDVGNKAVGVGEVSSIFLRTVLKETLTLKGVLSPVIALIKKEAAA